MMLATLAETMLWGVPVSIALVGFVGQACFFGRFLVQWVASERARKVVIPLLFWYLSLAGMLITVVYGVLRQDLVIILGQLTGGIVYVRNLILRRNERDGDLAA